VNEEWLADMPREVWVSDVTSNSDVDRVWLSPAQVILLAIPTTTNSYPLRVVLRCREQSTGVTRAVDAAREKFASWRTGRQNCLVGGSVYTVTNDVGNLSYSGGMGGNSTLHDPR